MVSYLWERYFLRQFITVFFFFLFCFYGLYVLIDYASHTSTLANYHFQITWNEVFRYYSYIFLIRAEFLIPVALLIAFVKTITSMNSHQELVALMASGVSLRRLLRPFLIFAFTWTLLLYANEEFLLPKALTTIRQIESATKHQNKKREVQDSVKNLVLEDGSLLLYQTYDHTKEQFFDVYWIPSIDDFYRMKFLSPSIEAPIGYFVDHFLRQENGELLQDKDYRERSFPEIRFNKEVLQSTIIDPDTLSLSNLSTHAMKLYHQELDEKGAKMMTAFYWKLGIPLLCLLAVLAPIRACVKFSRQLPIFFIYVLSLFGLIAFYMFMDATRVVAIKQVISPGLAIWTPLTVAFIIYGWRYLKI
jgi:lipopolysaccharide export system permease protein